MVLVDCDMRKSTISRYLHIPRDHIGITNTITGKDRTQLANALVNFKDLGIVVLPVGTIPEPIGTVGNQGNGKHLCCTEAGV